jgi:hypothetical protein
MGILRRWLGELHLHLCNSSSYLGYCLCSAESLERQAADFLQKIPVPENKNRYTQFFQMSSYHAIPELAAKVLVLGYNLRLWSLPVYF